MLGLGGVAIGLLVGAVSMWQQSTWLPVGLWLGGLGAVGALLYWMWGTQEVIDQEGIDLYFLEVLTFFVLIFSFFSTIITSISAMQRVSWSRTEVTPIENLKEYYGDWDVTHVKDKGVGIYTLTLTLTLESPHRRREKTWRIDEKTYLIIYGYASTGKTLCDILEQARGHL